MLPFHQSPPVCFFQYVNINFCFFLVSFVHCLAICCMFFTTIAPVINISGSWLFHRWVQLSLDLHTLLNQFLTVYLRHYRQYHFALLFCLQSRVHSVQWLLDQCVGLTVGSKVKVMHEVSVLWCVLLNNWLNLLHLLLWLIWKRLSYQFQVLVSVLVLEVRFQVWTKIFLALHLLILYLLIFDFYIAFSYNFLFTPFFLIEKSSPNKYSKKHSPPLEVKSQRIRTKTSDPFRSSIHIRMLTCQSDRCFISAKVAEFASFSNRQRSSFPSFSSLSRLSSLIATWQRNHFPFHF